jgi:hypothetical protein
MTRYFSAPCNVISARPFFPQIFFIFFTSFPSPFPHLSLAPSLAPSLTPSLNLSLNLSLTFSLLFHAPLLFLAFSTFRPFLTFPRQHVPTPTPKNL